MPVLIGLNDLVKNKSQDLVKGCDFFFLMVSAVGIMTLWSCMILPIKVLGKGRHNAVKVLQSLGCRSFSFAKQVNVPRQIDQRV